MIESGRDWHQLTKCIITIMNSRCVIAALLVGVIMAVGANTPGRRPNRGNSGSDDDCLDSTEVSNPGRHLIQRTNMLV